MLGGILLKYADNKDSEKINIPVTTYHEKKISKTLFRVTSVYTGKIDFKKALEELIARKILQQVATEGCRNSIHENTASK